MDITNQNMSGISRRGFLRNGLSLLGLPFFLSCGSFKSLPKSRSRLSARPGSPSEKPTKGLNTLNFGNRRDGLLYVPKSYAGDTPTPLFVALHGAGGSKKMWTSYYARAEARSMILLAPDSRLSAWDAIHGDFGPDVKFLDRALGYTFERCNIDPTRLALAGFSDGASYALSLGLSNGDLFSHLIAYSPGFIHHSEPVAGKPRIFISHGTQDNIIPIALSRDTFVPSLRDSGYEVTYREFEGGHQVPAEISESALDWFLDGK